MPSKIEELLTSIDASMRKLVVIAERKAEARVKNAKPDVSVMSDRDLDHPKWGDPQIKAKDPRDWTGESMIGKRLSECPPEYLDMLAERHEYFAGKAEESGELAKDGKPLAPYERRNAARCRGWANRVRNGWTPPADAEFAPQVDDETGGFE